MAAMQDDPRWIEHQQAASAVSAGLGATEEAHERYREALGPYACLLAEECCESARVPMMISLFHGGMPLGVIAIAFRATVAELEAVKDEPVFEEEPVDEIERLQRMPYAAFLRTDYWKRVRQEALERAEHRCLICNRVDGLEVHHRTYTRRGRERPADVQVLCGRCHTTHHKAMTAA